MSIEPAPDIGCVVIGRNDRDRLACCLDSVKRDAGHVVYVDSGSSDDSVAMARQLGVEVVELDRATPFSAARARNAGFSELMRRWPNIVYVLFLDGDCELVEGFVSAARLALDGSAATAVVAGRRLEAFPEASIYNRLCDIEWDTPVGDVRTCGGDALMRARAFAEVGGFNPAIVAGEEPELCFRLRAKGYRVLRIRQTMTMHDAAIAHFSQWWIRATRAGHAYAEGSHRHGSAPERHYVRGTVRALFWGMTLPAVAFGAAPLTAGRSLWLFSAYPISATRVYRMTRRRGYAPSDAAAYAAFLTLAKFAEVAGVVTYHLRRLRGVLPTPIEYKIDSSRSAE